MNYPIGIKTFEDLRNQNYVYVDKTKLVYELAHDFKYTLLRRPHRFGKSLLLSTLESYFKGQKSLFEGLAINDLEKEWIKYPVFVLELGYGLYDTKENFHKYIDYQISQYEKIYGEDPNEELLADRFGGVIRRAHEKEKLPVVILIDEYDKPIRETIGKSKLQKALRDELGSLYGVLKSHDKYIKFALLTGVTKFGSPSVLSDINCLADITFYQKYGALCGFTQHEIDHYFDESLREMAQSRNIHLEQLKEELRLMYDGYRFTKGDIKVYNPFSLLKALRGDNLGYFWFDTGIPLYLVKLLKKYHYDFSDLSKATSEESQLSKIDTTSSSDSIPLLFQSGYLTIKDYEPKRDRFTLGFPNKEVSKNFLEYLYPICSL